MTFCEYCKQWLHYECAGVMMEKVKEIEKFVCMPCSMKLYVQLNESSKITESVDLSESSPLVSVKFQEEITVLKNANTVLQNQVDYLSAARAQNEQMKPEIKALKEQAGTTSQDMIKLKEDLQEKEKYLASSENSLEIMNRRCASLEKEKLINERSILALKDQNEEYRQKAEDLQSKISELQLELNQHQKINKDLIESTLVPPSNDPSSDKSLGQACLKCKEKEKEVNSVKVKLDNMEKLEKDNRKEIKTLSTKVYEAERRLIREEKINDILMKLDDKLKADSAISSDADTASENPLRGTANNPIDPQQSEEIPPRNDANADQNFCETVFLSGLDSCQGCEKSHEFDPIKLARGVCVYELRRKGSCTKKDSCLYCHQVPSKCRNDKQLLAQAYEKKNASKRKVSLEVTETKEICPTEFYGGVNACQSKCCNRKHKLDHKRISKGPCCYEFFKKGSCPHKSSCRFTHELPLECLGDPNTRSSALISIQKLQDKVKATEVFGHEIVDEANRYWHTCSANKPNDKIFNAEMAQHAPPFAASNNTVSGILQPSVNDHVLPTPMVNYAPPPGHLFQQISKMTPQGLDMVQHPSFPLHQQNNFPSTQTQGPPSHSLSQDSVPYLPANISSFLRHCVKEHLSKEPIHHPSSNLQTCY